MWLCSTDYTLCWVGKSESSDDVADGGAPFLVLELKDPTCLSYKQMQDVLTQFASFIPSLPTDRELFQQQGLIRFRLLYCHPDSNLDSRTLQVFYPIQHLYSEMFYGNNDSTLALRFRYGSVQVLHGAGGS